MREILITGHKGFIGKHLFDLLNKDYNITGIDKKDKLPNKDFDLVIHLAGFSGVRESWKKPLAYFYNNLLLSWRVFKKYKRVIYASSSTAAEPWRNPYALSKYLVEKIAPKNSLGLRFTTVYGPGSRDNMFISRLINNKLQYVNIDCKRDFIHVFDIISFLKKLINLNLSGVMDVGTGKAIDLKDLVKYNIERRKSNFYEMKNNQADVTKLKLIGFKPKFVFDINE
jgi:nucleoside-diphosphate-sugar epimerase